MSKDNTAIQNPLSMSDDEIMNMDPSQFINNNPSEDLVQEEVEVTDASEEIDDTSEEEEHQQQEEETKEGEEEHQEESDEASEGEESEGNTSQTETKQSKASTESEATLDYEKEYKRLLAPFKANGREISVKSVDDAIALMQMGANYNRKMAGLKPHLKVLKMLEKQGLMDEQELSYLIDLKHKKPGAIEKLMKDGGIDPMDIDADKANEYSPGSYAVDEKEIELDQIIDEIKDTPSFSKTVDLVLNQWDAKSKAEITKYPEGIKIINDLMESGIHDLIVKEMENERLFGRLQGLTDLEAYRQVGDALNASGAFDHLGRQGQQTPPPARVVVPNPKKEDDSKLRNKRRAASPTKAGVPGEVKQDFNPLSMSDEEFEKLAAQRFL